MKSGRAAISRCSVPGPCCLLHRSRLFIAADIMSRHCLACNSCHSYLYIYGWMDGWMDGMDGWMDGKKSPPARCRRASVTPSKPAALPPPSPAPSRFRHLLGPFRPAGRRVSRGSCRKRPLRPHLAPSGWSLIHWVKSHWGRWAPPAAAVDRCVSLCDGSVLTLTLSSPHSAGSGLIQT